MAQAKDGYVENMGRFMVVRNTLGILESYMKLYICLRRFSARTCAT